MALCSLFAEFSSRVLIPPSPHLESHISDIVKTLGWKCFCFFEFLNLCVCLCVSHPALDSPSSGVASSNPSLGGEPPLSQPQAFYCRVLLGKRLEGKLWHDPMVYCI